MDPFLIAEKEQSAQGIHGKKNHLKNSKKTASFLIKLLHVIMVGNIAFCYTGIFHRYHHIKMGTGKIAIKITDLILGIKPEVQIRIGGWKLCLQQRIFQRMFHSLGFYLFLKSELQNRQWISAELTLYSRFEDCTITWKFLSGSVSRLPLRKPEYP